MPNHPPFFEKFCLLWKCKDKYLHLNDRSKKGLKRFLFSTKNENDLFPPYKNAFFISFKVNFIYEIFYTFCIDFAKTI